jgi:VCBS repeat-containing protein
MAVEAERDGGLPNDSVENAEILVQQFQGSSAVIGTPFEGSISAESDVDYYKIEVAGPGLVQINFSTLSPSISSIWALSLINSDETAYLPLTSRLDSDGATLSAAVEEGATELTVQGVDGDPSQRNVYFEGSTDVYKVLDSDLTSGAGTLTIAAAPAQDSGAVLQFDPAYLATGQDVILNAVALEAGNYYLKISKATSFSSASYSIQASVTPTGESGYNDVKADIADATNRLLQDVWMQGTLSDDNDVDYWSFTTTSASDFDIEFLGSGGSDDIPDWAITVTNWTGTNLTDTPLVSAVQFSAGAYATQSFSQQQDVAKTYLVKVAAAKEDVSTLGYYIKVSGANLDLNDTPVSTLGDVSSLSSGAYLSAYTSDELAVVVKSLPAAAEGEGGDLQLSSLFVATDTDSAQSLTYKVVLKPAIDSQAVSHLEATVDGETVSYAANGETISFTAEEYETAKFFPGDAPGDSVLLFQAVDDSLAKDGSGYGALMELVMRVVDGNYRVIAEGTTPGVLTEGSADTKDLISVKLGYAPADDETVTIYLDHGLEEAGQYQLSFNKASLTFTSETWDTVQVVSVTAREDLRKESEQAGELSFRVTSSDTASAYNGLAVEGFTYQIVDVPNHPATGAVSFTVGGDVLQQGATLSAADTLSDVEGKTKPTVYRWSSSSDGVVWGSGFATGSTVTLTQSQVGKYIRVAGEFIDDEGNSEKVFSDISTSKVSNVNDAPSLKAAQSDIMATAGSLYSYSLPAGTFADVDAGDTLSYSWKLLDSASGTTANDLPTWLTVSADGKTLSSDAVGGAADDVLYVQVTATDSDNASVSDVFSLTIKAADAGAPQAKVLIPDQSVNEGSPLDFVFSVGTFEDPDGGVLTYGASTTATDDRSLPAWLNFDPATRTFSGTPSNIDVGILPITVKATDITGKSVSDVFLLEVKNVNALPTGTLSSNSLSVAVKQGSVLTASANISDADGLPTSAEYIYQWQSKAVDGEWTDIIGANATTVTLTQAEVGKTVRATVRYQDLMGTNETFASATHTSTVANVNDAPVGTAVSVTTDEDTAKTGTLAGTDADGDALTFSKVSDPSHGTVTIASNGSYTYTPTANYNGTDSFTFKVNDGTVDSVDATVSITVSAVNDAPVGTAVSITTDEDTAKTGTLAGTDVDGDALTFSKVSDPSHGTVTIASNGSYTYTPTANYNGTDSFTFKVNDGAVDSESATVSITVSATGKTVAGQVKGWRGDASLGDVVVKSSDEADAITDTSDTDGTFTLPSVPGSQAAIQVTKSGFTRGEALEASITLSDVIDNLKVFLNLSLSYEAPFKHVSADFNGDGKHDLSDVIGVLKYFLGLDTGTALPEWVFVNEADLNDSGYPLRWDDNANGAILDKSHTQPAPLNVDLAGDTSDLQVIGVLRGDMNGSFFDA